MTSQLSSPMKCLVVAALLHLCAVAAQAADLEEIISRCSRAIGGPRGVAGLRTLKFLETGSDRARDLIWEIRRPNLVRKERPGKMIVVFDGQRAGFLEAPPLKDGTPGQPRLIPPQDWHHFEMDIALFIPAFFEYPATYGGVTRAEHGTAHILEVALPMGGTAVYWVDARSFLPVKVALPDWRLERVLGGWEEVGGYLLPRSYWEPSSPEDVTRLENMEVNLRLPEQRFLLPEWLEVR